MDAQLKLARDAIISTIKYHRFKVVLLHGVKNKIYVW